MSGRKLKVEKLDEYEDVHGKTKRLTVTFINKEKSYRKTIPLKTRGSPSQLEDRDGIEGHFARACQDKSVNKQNLQKNKFSSPVKAESNVVQVEDSSKNIVTSKIDTPESTCNFLAESIDRLKVIKVKYLDVILDGMVDSGAQTSVVRADLVKVIECTGGGKMNSEIRRTFIKLQKDETLISIWEQANKKEKTYEIHSDLLVHNDVVCGEPIKQVVLPACKRAILQMAHEIPLSGHLGERETKQRIKYSFFLAFVKKEREHIAKHANLVSYEEL
ncbi:retrovirus-related Pol polyprotein from transposon opus [Trichonephila clavipes]|nr:retrovirus-related Pol polyprotein from transposon opus [Trichonephila clavipes]